MAHKDPEEQDDDFRYLSTTNILYFKRSITLGNSNRFYYPY
nr:hypothetical protein [Paucilactobacillus hokkaidonensis]